MKTSNLILIALFTLLTLGLFATNYLLKKEYEKTDKTDKYWNYQTLLNKPFKHLIVKGGNLAQVCFEPNDKFAVKQTKWEMEELKGIETNIMNDTLYISFPDTFMQTYFVSNTYLSAYPMLIIQAPELASINGNNCNLLLRKMKQTNYAIELSGKSNFVIESINEKLKKLDLIVNDSVQFELKNSINERGNIYIDASNLKLNGGSRIFLSNAHITNLQFQIGENATAELSGYNLNRINTSMAKSND